MKTGQLLDRSRVELQLAGYGVAPVTAISDPSIHPRVQEYRRQTGSRMAPLDKEGIRQRVPQAEFHVSRKIDGEFTVLVFREGEVFTVNPGGAVRVGMPWMEEAVQRLAAADVKEALVAGELYVERADESRARVHDVTTVTRSPNSTDDLDRLRFGVFDLMSLDGKTAGDCFADTWRQIEKLFGGASGIHPVEAVDVSSIEEIEKQFDQWVEKEGAEGIVLRSDTAGRFKVKPRHTLDVVVVGFTESTDEREGLLHDLLVALMRNDGTLQVLTRVGGGFSDDQRREMLGELKDMVVESEYAEVNADHVAYQMVRPEWVVEISCIDLVSQTTIGGPVGRMVLDWNVGQSGSYHIVRRMPLASVISPQFIRRREDKSACPEDVRIQQATDLVEVPLADRNARDVTLPKSEVLRREVFTKQLKGETMVRKFVLWKTNKEQESEDFPAYVLHYTDFSPNRKTPLARDIRVSSSREQMDSLWDGLMTANIKKGWEPCEPAAKADEAPKAAKEVAEAAAPEETKPVKKKAVAKKKEPTAKKKEPAAKKKEPAAKKKEPAAKKKEPAAKKKEPAAKKKEPAAKKTPAKKKATAKKKAAKKKSG